MIWYMLKLDVWGPRTLLLFYLEEVRLLVDGETVGGGF